jgi:hypothetical protein
MLLNEIVFAGIPLGQLITVGGIFVAIAGFYIKISLDLAKYKTLINQNLTKTAQVEKEIIQLKENIKKENNSFNEKMDKKADLDIVKTLHNEMKGEISLIRSEISDVNKGINQIYQVIIENNKKFL